MRNVRIAIEVEPFDPRAEPFLTSVTSSTDEPNDRAAAVIAVMDCIPELAQTVGMDQNELIKVMFENTVNKFRNLLP